MSDARLGEGQSQVTLGLACSLEDVFVNLRTEHIEPLLVSPPLLVLRLTLKLGPRYDMGAFVPKKEEGWVVCASGKDFAVWEKKA